MNALRLILRSLLYHWRGNLAVACGVAVGTAVLTGALVVGDSMRGSLRRLALERLGRIDYALVTDRFFREKLADEVSADDIGASQTAPAILLRASVAKAEAEPPLQANGVNLIGCDERFWRLGDGGPRQLPRREEIVLNAPLAEQLEVAAGDTVILRLPRPAAIPAESPLGRKRGNVRNLRLRVSEVIAARGLGRFGLRPTQQLPRNAYVSLAAMQWQIDQEVEHANAIFVAAPMVPITCSPRLSDYGIRVDDVKRGIHSYFDITSDRMLLDPAAEREIMADLKNLVLPGGAKYDVSPILTYLANTIACGDRSIPYSTITAINFPLAGPALGPFLSPEGKVAAPLGEDEIALNSWAAAELHAKLGDTVRVTYFEPESTHRQFREKTVALRLTAIVQLSGAADDPNLTPTVRGVTDQLSMRKWDPPFPFYADRIHERDDEYWRAHRATPKAFVSLATGRRLWASRFGQTTSIRIAPTFSVPVESFEWAQRQIAIDPAAMGFIFQPVRAQSLAAAAGTTPFNVLFLAFSSFLIAAAVMLVTILFRLGIDRRAAQAGILLATGFRQRQVGRLFAAEGLMVAALGSMLGIAVGVGYAALMLAGLRTWWLAAVVTPFLQLYVTPASLAIGYASGLILAGATIAVSVRRIGRIAPRRLLANDLAGRFVVPTSRFVVPPSGFVVPPLGGSGATHPLKRALQKHPLKRALQTSAPWLLLALAAAPAIGLLGVDVREDIQAAAFFAAGSVSLGSLLGIVWIRLRAGATGPAVAAGRGNLVRLAVRNAARHPGRSTLTIGLVASASFLIAAVSAFRLDPTTQTPSLASGNGGFTLVAQSDQPIFGDLNTSQGRADLGFSAEDDALLGQCSIFSLRVRAGDDASCLNLYRPQHPRLLGVPRELIDRGGFAWADAPRGEANPWQLLEPPPLQRPATPIILDKNTANYSLHLWNGRGEFYELTDPRGRTLLTEVAALLADSIFQGDLLVSEEALLRYDPEVSGYRFFLIEAPAEKAREVQKALERTLEDVGLTVETTADRLSAFAAVQNTYLSTFQSLGGLGLLLGTVGLAAVQLRNVLERRGELALLRATGFRRRTLAWLVLLENVVLLLAGLACGALAALVAVLPHLAGRGASVPWFWLAGTLGLVLAVGIVASLAAVRAVIRAPLLAALRRE